jgi:hypothetical protein
VSRQDAREIRQSVLQSGSAVGAIQAVQEDGLVRMVRLDIQALLAGHGLNLQEGEGLRIIMQTQLDGIADYMSLEHTLTSG